MTKRQYLEKLLEKGMAVVALDPRPEDVDVPTFFKKHESLRVNLSWGFKTYMTLSENGVDADLSFSKVTSRVRIPWGRIYNIASRVSGESKQWEESIPDGLKCRMVSEVLQAAKGRHLKLVKA